METVDKTQAITFNIKPTVAPEIVVDATQHEALGLEEIPQQNNLSEKTQLSEE